MISQSIEQEIIFLSKFFSLSIEDQLKFQKILKMFYLEHGSFNTIKDLDSWLPIINTLESTGINTDYFRVLICTYISHDHIDEHFQWKSELEQAKANREIIDPERRLNTLDE